MTLIPAHEQSKKTDKNTPSKVDGEESKKTQNDIVKRFRAPKGEFS